jgi:hypothetical protein
MVTESVSPQGTVDAALTRTPLPALRMLDAVDAATPTAAVDPGTVILTCANCGAQMDERKCKLICRCGYFLSCSDYY